MASLHEIDSYLRDFLAIGQIPDFPFAHNGLQIENSGTVRKIAAAVDSHLPVLQQAVERKADLLLVHHGLFWQGVQPVTGPYYRKLKLAFEHNLALISIHHPLDAHPTVGNNARLAESLGLSNGEPFFPFQGVPIGLKFPANHLSRSEIAARLEATLGGPVHLAAGGPVSVRVVGICTGGAGSEIASAVRQGIDTFITGEGPHWSHTLAEELGVNLFLGGHYATETFGVKALGAHLAERFGIEWEFIDHPTGL